MHKNRMENLCNIFLRSCEFFLTDPLFVLNMAVITYSSADGGYFITLDDMAEMADAPDR